MTFILGTHMQVLLIEDDPTLGAGLKAGLEQSGFSIAWVTSLMDATTAIEESEFAAILLDLGLPDGDGMSLLRRLRRHKNTTPVMVVTARGQRETRIAGFDEGADDYVTKPYDLDEVVARIRALIRRSEGVASNFVHFGDFELDLKGQIVRLGEHSINLTLREFRVLSLLATRAGRWVSKPDIELTIYEDSVGVESNTIEAAVYGLRKKLGLQTIITARGLGYMIKK